MGCKRIWMITDTHFGVRANSMEWFEICKEYLDNVFIPLLKENVKDGDVLVHMGDVFDNRQSVNLKIGSYVIDLFERLGEILPVHVIVGNHDIYMKKSNSITSIDQLKYIPNVNIYKDATMKKWSGKNCLLMPWRRDKEHEAETLAEHNNADIVFCHAEIKGLKLNAKVTNLEGSPVSHFKNYKKVYSGHIHFAQKKNNVRMNGTPYQLTRSDIGNPKGIWMLDLDTSEETFFENLYSPNFMKINVVQSLNITLGDFKKTIKNNFVDLYVSSKIASSYNLSGLINEVQGLARKLEPNIYEEENFLDNDFYDMQEIESLYKEFDIMNLCEKYVDGMGHDADMKEKLKKKIKSLYTECAYKYNPDV